MALALHRRACHACSSHPPRALPLLALAALPACSAASRGSSGGTSAASADDAGSLAAAADGGALATASDDAGASSAFDDGGDGAPPRSHHRAARRAGRRPPPAEGVWRRRRRADFGPNVLIFDPSMSMTTIQSQLAQVYTQMDSAQFGTGRYALFFKPGSVQPRRASRLLYPAPRPRAVARRRRHHRSRARQGRLAREQQRHVQLLAGGRELRRHSHAGDRLERPRLGGLARDGDPKGARDGDDRALRQRRLVERRLHRGLEDRHPINSGSQQQFLTRNVDLTDWQGSNWNMVFVGDGSPRRGPGRARLYDRDEHAEGSREAVPLHRCERRRTS